jgi:hypothetical protein
MGHPGEGQRADDRGQTTEGRRQRADDRGQTTEGRRQRADDRGQTTEDGGQMTDEYRISNKKPQNDEVIPSTFEIPCSIFCGSKKEDRTQNPEPET